MLIARMNTGRSIFRSSPLLALLVSLLFGSAGAYADPLPKVPDVAFFGVGGLSCQELVSQNPIFGPGQDKLLHWATGYMSGLATWMKSEGYEASVTWDRSVANTLKPFLNEYCRRYPEDQIASAVASFYKFRLLPKPLD